MSRICFVFYLFNFHFIFDAFLIIFMRSKKKEKRTPNTKTKFIQKIMILKQIASKIFEFLQIE
jgi:hypothetical protein